MFIIFYYVKCLNNIFSYKYYNGVYLTMMYRLDYGICSLIIAIKCKDDYLFDQFCSKNTKGL